MSGQVFAVASGKGGVGKTTTVVNLGVTLRAGDHSVALVDADLGMPNLATFFGLDPEPTIHELLAGSATLDEVVIEEADGFAIVPGSRDLASFAHADPTGLGEVVEALAADYEFVLIDTGAGLSYEDVLPLALVDGVLLVTSPDPAALGDTKRTATIADIIDDVPRGLVVTHATDSTDPTAIAEDLGAELLGAIPEDPTVKESTAGGRPLEAYDPECPAAGAYRQLADAFADLDVARSKTRAPDGAGGVAATDDESGAPEQEADATDEGQGTPTEGETSPDPGPDGDDVDDGGAAPDDQSRAEDGDGDAEQPGAEAADGAEDEGDGETPSEAEPDYWPGDEDPVGEAGDASTPSPDEAFPPGESGGVSNLIETLGRGDKLAESSGDGSAAGASGDDPAADQDADGGDADPDGDYTAGIWGDETGSNADGADEDGVEPSADDDGGFLTRLKRRFV